MKYQESKTPWHLNVFDKKTKKFIVKNMPVGFSKEEALKNAELNSSNWTFKNSIITLTRVESILIQS